MWRGARSGEEVVRRAEYVVQLTTILFDMELAPFVLFQHSARLVMWRD